MSPGTRPARTKLSRTLVVDTAVELFTDADEVSIRELARRLAVSPMALYRHVESKEDLLAEVVDRLLGAAWRPDVDPQQWRTWTVQAADRLRQFLVERPPALQLYLRRPVRTPTALQRMSVAVEVLRGGLGDERRAHSAFAAVHSYTVGFAALEASREGNPVPADPDEDPVLLELAAFASPAQFRAGLNYLLDGIVADVAHNID